MARAAELKKTKACPECGGAMHYERRNDRIEYKGHFKVIPLLGWWCGSCAEAIFEGRELLAAERAFVELRAEVEDALLPEEVAKIREKLSISQREAGRLLGGGPRAFQKYESGAVPVSMPMKNLLVLLGNDPRRLEEIRKREDKRIGSRSRKTASAPPSSAPRRKRA